jgi:hypothetical protein
LTILDDAVDVRGLEDETPQRDNDRPKHQFPPGREVDMLVVRNVFELKFGKAREAVAVMKEGIAIQKRALADAEYSTRLLTDVTGQFYALVFELTVPNLASYESYAPRLFADKEWQANYQKFTALVESGHREVFTIVE